MRSTRSLWFESTAVAECPVSVFLPFFRRLFPDPGFGDFATSGVAIQTRAVCVRLCVLSCFRLSTQVQFVASRAALLHPRVVRKQPAASDRLPDGAAGNSLSMIRRGGPRHCVVSGIACSLCHLRSDFFESCPACSLGCLNPSCAPVAKFVGTPQTARRRGCVPFSGD